MLREQLSLLAPLLSAFIVLSLLILYVHYSTDRLYRLKLVLGPALLLACVFAVPFVGVKLGYGWPAPLPQSFEYVAHKSVVIDSEKRWIDVLVLSRKPFKADSRLHRIPWTQKLEDSLEKAKEMKEGREGGEIVMNGQGVNGDQRGDEYPDYIPKRVLPQEQRPKPALVPRQGDENPERSPSQPRDLSPAFSV